jgi:hypothetical protein
VAVTVGTPIKPPPPRIVVGVFAADLTVAAVAVVRAWRQPNHHAPEFSRFPPYQGFLKLQGAVVRFRGNPAKSVCFQHFSARPLTRKPLVDNSFESLLAVIQTFAEQKFDGPKTALEPVQTRDFMPWSPSENGS